MSITSMIARGGHLVHVQRPVETRDAQGGRETTWTRTATSVPAWVQSAGAALIEIYSRRNLVVSHRVFVAQDLEVKEGHCLIWNEKTLVVVGVSNAAGMNHLWIIDVREIR